MLGWRCKASVVFNGVLIVVVYSVVSEAEPGAGPEPWLTLSGNGGRGGAGGRVRDSCLVRYLQEFVYVIFVVVFMLQVWFLGAGHYFLKINLCLR